MIPSLLCGYQSHTLALLRGLPLRVPWNGFVLLVYYYGGSVALSVSTFRRSRFCAYGTCRVFRCPFVLCRVHYPPYIEESVRLPNWAATYFFFRINMAYAYFDVAISGMV